MGRRRQRHPPPLLRWSRGRATRPPPPTDIWVGVWEQSRFYILYSHNCSYFDMIGHTCMLIDHQFTTLDNYDGTQMIRQNPPLTHCSAILSLGTRPSATSSSAAAISSLDTPRSSWIDVFDCMRGLARDLCDTSNVLTSMPAFARLSLVLGSSMLTTS